MSSRVKDKIRLTIYYNLLKPTFFIKEFMFSAVSLTVKISRLSSCFILFSFSLKIEAVRISETPVKKSSTTFVIYNVSPEELGV
jgi:hypothetical protein